MENHAKKMDNCNDISMKQNLAHLEIMHLICNGKWKYTYGRWLGDMRLDELSFVTFCETTIKEIETQGKTYQADIEECQLYKLWQTVMENFNEQQTKVEH